MHDIRTSVVTKKTDDGLTNFQIEFREGPRRRRQSLGTKDRREAERKRAEIDRMITHGTFDPWGDKVPRDGVTLAEAQRAFMRAKKRAGLRDKTLAGYGEVTARFVSETMRPGARTNDVRPADIERFLATPPKSGKGRGRKGTRLSPESEKTYLRTLTAFFNWMHAEGMMRDVPEVKRSGRKAKKAKKLPAFLSHDDYAKLIRWIEGHAALKGQPGTRDVVWVADAVRVAVGTGLRRGELCRLRWEDVDLKAEKLRVRSRPGEETKSGHERDAPITGHALTTLRRLHAARTSEDGSDHVLQAARGGPMDPNKLSGTFGLFRKKAGLPSEITLHSTRRTFASWWVIEGGSIYKLRDALGHEDVSVTQVYADLSPDSAVEEGKRVLGKRFARLNGPETPADAEEEADAVLSEEARENARLRAENERLRAEVERLRALIGDTSGDSGAGPLPSLTVGPGGVISAPRDRRDG